MQRAGNRGIAEGAEDGQIVLTPVRIQRADAVRAKLAELEISEQDVEAAVTWARSAGSPR